mgnify:CR=1 FL=1
MHVNSHEFQRRNLNNPAAILLHQKGISYQAVILDPAKIEIPGSDISGQPLVNGNVWVKFAIVSGTTLQFEEIQQTKTDAYGLVNLTIGSVASTAFNAITWDAVQKSLQVYVSFDNGSSYTKVSDQKLTYSPYALFAETAGKLGSTLGIAGGGTGATTAATARTNLGLVIGTNVQAPLTAGTDYLAPNTSIIGATKTKLTYDTKGLITAGTDATTADIAPSTNRNYVTDVQAGVISNTSGVNTGDETTSSIKSKLSITTLSGSNTGDQVLPTLLSLGAVPTSRVITINGIGLDLSSDRSYTINTGLTLADLESSNVKAKTFELTQPTAINSTTTTTLDLSNGNLLELVLTGPTTLDFSNPKIGTYIIKVKQDGAGGRTLTFPIMKWADAAVPTITTAANAIDLITLIYDGTHYYGSCLQNF